jgi:putative ABC transport system permease protein
MNFRATLEGVQIAIEALRSNKVRAFLTILGVAIGVATVTGMAAIMAGVEKGLSEDIEAVGKDNFKLARFDQSKIQIGHRAPWEGKPKITMAEAQAIAALPSIQSVTPLIPGGSPQIKYGARTFTSVGVQGFGVEWPNYTRGDFTEGRTFIESEAQRSAPVAVISQDLAQEMFEGRTAVGERIRIGGASFEVIGVFKPKPNLFSGSSKDLSIYVPVTAALKYLPVNDDWLELLVVPSAAAGQARAMDDATMAMRAMRHLGPQDENNFAFIRMEAFAELLGKITGTISLVMLVLASIGLMVGGVGVVGIMLISVTERTREIGVRKALGAKRREILWQFLVEATTVTVIGAVVGLVFGAGGGLLLGAVTPIPATVPLWAVFSALFAAAFTGIIFGLYPAWKAARLDPVEALRYE